jgi:hypothetical protein
MNHPALGIVVMLFVSGGLGTLGWMAVKEWKNRKDD